MVDIGDSQVTKRPDAGSIRARRARAAFSYEPQQDDELALKVGDILIIHGEDEEGWFEATLNGKRGVCPSNFVEFVPEPESADMSSTTAKKENIPSEKESDSKTSKKDLKDKLNAGLASKESDPASKRQSVADPLTDAAPHDEARTTEKPKKVQGVGLGNIFAGGQVKLRSGDANGQVKLIGPAADKKGSTKSMEEKKSESTKKENGVDNEAEYAKAEFDYEAQNGDELSFKAGDIIQIITKECEDEGWWKGKLNGLVGVFPDNFCKILSTSDGAALLQKQNAALENKGTKDPTPKDSKSSSDSTPKPATTSSSTKSTAPVAKVAASDSRKSTVEDSAPSKSNLEKPEKPAKPVVVGKPLVAKKPAIGGDGSRETSLLKEVTSKPSAPSKPSSEKPVEEKKKDTKTHDEDDKQSGINLDTMINENSKLSHPTASRVRGPQRRPPSVLIASKDDVTNGSAANGLRDPMLDVFKSMPSTSHDEESPETNGDGKAAVKKRESFLRDLDHVLSRPKSPSVRKSDSAISFSSMEDEVKLLKDELSTVKEEFTAQLKELKELLKTQIEKTISMEKEIAELKKAK